MTTRIFTTAFANAKVFTAGMESLRRTVDFAKLDAKHYIIDNHYPLNAADAHNAIYAYAQKDHRVAVCDAGRNLGLHEGLNYLFATYGADFHDDDMLIGYDADEDPQTVGWADAMAKVFALEPRAGWISMNCKAINEGLVNVPVQTIAGDVRVRIPSSCMMNVVVGWRVGVVRKMGLFTEPHKFYGGLEVAMQPLCRDLGYWVCFLEDYWTLTHRAQADLSYELYKLHHVGHKQPMFEGSFDEWIKANP